MTDAERSLTRLSPSKLALLRQLARAGGLGDSDVALSIPQREPGSPIPLSYAQEPLWFFSQTYPADTTYNVIYLIGIAGRLHLDAVERSLTAIFARHEILRTTFPMTRGKPQQVVARETFWSPTIVDLSGMAPELWEQVILALIRDEADHSFDLAAGPLTRSVLLTLGQEMHILFNSMHHIVCDTWSVGLFDREFRLHYDAYSQGRPVPLPPRPFQFGDFAIWERERLQGELLERHLAYWRRQFDGVTSLQLPVDRSPPTQRSFPAHNELVVLDEALTAALKDFSLRHGVSLFMTLLTGLKVLLARYTQQFDITIGTPNANRSRPDIEDMIGFTTTLFALRTDLSGGVSFRDALSRVKESTLGAYEHQEVPLQKILSEVKPARSDPWSKRHSMFQVMFSFQSIRFPETRSPTELNLAKMTKLVRFTIPHPSAKSDLYLYLRDLNGRLIGGFEYDTDIFERDSIVRMRKHLETLLASAIANPDLPISRLAYMPDEERARILQEWSGESRAYQDGLCLHEHFERQARRTPDGSAVSIGEDMLTYAELSRRSDRLGQRLASHGVAPETAVGLFLDRSIELAVGILGVLKAGGVCVPLDPSLPAERVRTMIESAAAPIVLSQRSQANALPASSARFVLVDDEAEEVGDAFDPVPVSPQGAAFIFFTSGSTGEPNGVVVPHRAAASGQCSETAAIKLGADDRLLMTTPISSARLLGEFFWPLFAGAEVCMARPERHQDHRYLAREIAARRISVVSMVPAMLQAFLSNDTSGCTSLKCVFPVGEALPQTVKDAFMERLDASLCNVYAQTEACPVSFGQLNNDPGRPAACIGKPGLNMRVYVLDPELEPVPVGVTGELYVSGDSVARGYLGRPGLTAAKFIPDPFGSEPGRRLYRTGDIARYLSDGDLVSLGRRDLRVKLRGYRIELQEIEAALTQHASVSECAAAVSGRSPSEARLRCFVVPADEASPRANELRRFLKERLPLYMVPAQFAFLAELPRLQSGKVDRKALTEIMLEAIMDDARSPIQTPLEAEIAEVWRSVLKLDRIGADDNFFDLGGDSLSAMEAIAKLEESGIAASLKEMIFAPLSQIATSAAKQSTNS